MRGDELVCINELSLVGEHISFVASVYTVWIVLLMTPEVCFTSFVNFLKLKFSSFLS